MKEWLAAGIRVLPVVASVAMAKLAQRAGACAVIAEGGESGGHVGDTSTLVLVPQVCDAVSVPVIAAGGIADARALAAVFMLGARGAQIGTRFLVADECAAHDNYKDKVIKARDISTIVTGRRLGLPVRSLKTAFSRKYAEQEFNAGVSNEDLEAFAVGALRLAAQQGDDMRGCFLAGQAAGLVNRRQPAADIVREMVTGARDILLGAGAWVN
jgi:enoyl-[acyl-carrier protein] reductase II